MARNEFTRVMFPLMLIGHIQHTRLREAQAGHRRPLKRDAWIAVARLPNSLICSLSGVRREAVQKAAKRRMGRHTRMRHIATSA